ncbi:hypothetical protein HK104_002117, partial [Borealophlyctis nickersoniae]
MDTLHGFTALDFILTNTLVPKSTKKQVENVGLRKERFPHLMNHLLEAVQAVSDECKSVFESLEKASVTLQHVNDTMDSLIDINHSVLDAYGVSHPSLERVRQITARHNLRSKLTGAGGGGCALTFVRSDSPREAVRLAHAELEKEGFECYETSVGCPGVRACRVGDATVEEFGGVSWEAFGMPGDIPWARLEK